MEKPQSKSVLLLAANIRSSISSLNRSPSEVVATGDQPVLPHSLFKSTRRYIENVAHQVNRCYSSTCYDACAVMIRRLLEMLIIEAYVHASRDKEIRDQDGNYVGLAKLVEKSLSDFRFGQKTREALRGLKDYGDLSAHGLRYNTKREYIDEHIFELRIAVEELTYHAGFRK